MIKKRVENESVKGEGWGLLLGGLVSRSLHVACKFGKGRETTIGWLGIRIDPYDWLVAEEGFRVKSLQDSDRSPKIGVPYTAPAALKSQLQAPTKKGTLIV